MAPINLPDGTEVSEIVLPDGTTASAVIAPDGSTVFSTIPDSVVSRDPDDNSKSSFTANGGLIFETAVDWPEIQFEVSSNTSGVGRAQIKEHSSGTVIATKSLSSLSSGDVFTVTVSLTAGKKYQILLDNNGNGYQSGFDDNPSFNYSSTDGNLTITNGIKAGGSSSDAFNVSKIGNIN